ncbi:MAG: Ig-like domain-containing protein, partial [Bacteroidota bacterium]
NCGIKTLTFALSGATSGSGTSLNNITFNKGTTTVTWIAVDSANNSVNCSFSVQVNDNTNPVIICPANVVLHSAPGACSLASVSVNLGTPSVYDNCGVAGIVNNAPAISYPVGLSYINWTVTDGSGNSTSCQQIVTILGVPMAVNDSAVTNEDTSHLINVLLNDLDCDHNYGASSVNVLANPSHGNAIVNPINGMITYFPNPNYNGNDQFTYGFCDSSGFCTQAIVYIVVLAVNDSPVTVNEYLTTFEDASALGSVLVNGDYDPDGTALDALTIPVDGPGYGSITIYPTGVFIYTPANNYNGMDTVVVSICDQGIPFPSSCSNDSIFILVNPVNDAPVTFDEAIVVPEDSLFSGNVLLNADFDPDGTSLTVNQAPLAGPSHGSIIIDSLGNYTYTPFPGYNGSDQVVVSICDHGVPMPSACSNDIIIIDVIPKNDAPVTFNEYIVTTEDVSYTGSVLNNGDIDPDGTTLSVATLPVSGPAHGTIIVHPNGVFTYTPGINYYGQDMVVLSVCDGGIPLPAACSNDTLFISITPVNDPPVTFNEHLFTNEDTPFIGNMLANGDYDIEGTPLGVIIYPVMGPLHGSVNISNNGQFTYSPGLNYNGQDIFVVNVCDYGIPLPSACSYDTVFIGVNAVNDSPITFNEHLLLLEDTPFTGSVLSNGDFDPDGTNLIVSTSPISGPAHGTIIISPNGAFIYTPTPNYFGQEMVVLSVCDGGIPLPAACSNDTLFLTINPVNDVPVTVNEHVIIAENTSYSGSILNGDLDPDGTALAATTMPLYGPAHGSVGISPGGIVTYIPAAYFNGFDTVVISLCDGGIPLPAACASDTLFITVTPVNSEPVIYNEHLLMCADGFYSGNVLANGDWDPEGTQLTAVISPVFGPLHGQFILSNNGDFSYQPTVGFYGMDTVVIGIYDAGVPLPPAVNNDTVFVRVNQAIVADGGPSQQWCNAVNTFLVGNFPSGTNGSWSQLSGPNTVQISPHNAPIAGVSGLIGGTYKFIYTLTTVYPSGNCFSTDTLIVINNNLPSVSYAGPDQIICVQNGNTASTVINGNIPAFGHGYWEQVIGPTVAVFSDSLSNNCTISNLVTGDYGFNWVIENGMCAANYDYVHIHVNAAPMVDAGLDGQTCQAIPFMLSGASASNCQSLHWTTSGNGIFSNPTNKNPVYYPSLTDALAGVIVLTLVGEAEPSCSDVVDTMILTVTQNPPLICPYNISVSTDSGICSAYVNVPALNLTSGIGCVTNVQNNINGTDDASGIYLLGTTSVVWTVTYANGSTTNCTQTITVIDSIPPSLSCGGNISVNLVSGCDATVWVPNVNSYDNCTLSNLTWTITGATVAASSLTGINQIGSRIFNHGLSDVTFIASDLMGNSATCSLTVNVIDTIVPTIVCPPTIITATTPGACSANGVILANPLVNDNCNTTILTSTAPSVFPLDSTIVIYTVLDSSGNTSSCSQLVIVNAAPFAATDFATTDEDTPVVIDILANDSDCDSNLNPGSVVISVSPIHGTVTVDTNTGAVAFTPDSNFYDTDQFDYLVCDFTGLCSNAVVYININPINDAPVVGDSLVNVSEDSTITICLPVTDPDGPLPLIFSGISCISNGNASAILNSGTICITYTPIQNYSGSDTVCVTVCDSLGLCDIGMLIINILPVNDPPFIHDTLVNLEQDSMLFICLPITDVDGDMPYSISGLGCIDNGDGYVFANLQEACIVYIPDSGFVGMDTVCFVVCDLAGACSNAYVYINVYPNPSQPVIGLAKLAGVPQYQPDGSYNLTFLFKVANLGNRPLYNIQLTDNLRKTFPCPVDFTLNAPPSVTGQLVQNCFYNGISDTNLLVSAASSLLPGQTETILIFLNIVPKGSFGPFLNTALVKAADTSGLIAWDVSNKGTEVDPDGDGNPNENGENNPTPVFLPPNAAVGLAKAVSEMTQLDNGSYNVTYVITVQNLYLDSLNHIQVVDDLDATFPSPVVFSMVNPAAANSTLTANTSFNGKSEINLLVPEASFLEGGQSGTITFTVNISFAGESQIFYNSAFGSAVGPVAMIVSDSSTNGYIADPNGNSNPADPGENEPTPLLLSPSNVFIPDGFSPDGDGVNDYFVIPGIERFPDCRLAIFNRWGNKVFSKMAYDNSWHGEPNVGTFELGRDKVPQGTYYYILEFNKDNLKSATGFIVIKY